MRVSFNSFPDSLVNQLSTLTSQQNRLQNQVATGRRISQLEDDPAAMRQVLNLQTQDSQVAQYRQNIASLQENATSSYSALKSLEKISSRAGVIATSADGLDSATGAELPAYADEANSLLEQGLQAMNTQYQGNYIFGGTRTDQPPYVATRDASGQITAITYQGNDTVPSSEIATGTAVSVLVPGSNTTGTGPAGVITDTRNGADFFNHLIALRDHLVAKDTNSISTIDTAALAKDEDNITLQIGTNGVVQSQLSTADDVAATQSIAFKQMVSQHADVDMAATITKLSATQTAYQAALQSGASMLNQSQSLLSYIQ